MIAAFGIHTPHRTTSLAVWLTRDHAGSFLWLTKPAQDPQTGIFSNPYADTIAIPDALTASWPMGTCRRMVLQQPIVCN